MDQLQDHLGQLVHLFVCAAHLGLQQGLGDDEASQVGRLARQNTASQSSEKTSLRGRHAATKPRSTHVV